MRKKCVSCEFICFLADDTCKKCGSAELEILAVREDLPRGKIVRASTLRIFLTYFFCFCLAVVVEFIALLPILLQIGSHGKGGSDGEKAFLIILFIIHLPSILLSWFLGDGFLLLTPFLQIVFWTCLFGFIAGKRTSKLR